MGKVILKPVSKIKARLGLDANGSAQRFFTSECERFMKKYVPGGEKGLLAKNVSVQSDKIIYQSPYAHYQFIGKKYEDPDYHKGAFYNEDYGFWSRPGVKKDKTNTDLNYHTPGTGARWDRKMVNSDIEELCEEVKNFIERGGK